MKVLVLDIESYYADDYTLSKMTSEEYIRDPRFEIIGVAFGYLDEEIRWYSGDLAYIKSVLAPLPWHDIICVGHNMSGFDALILTEVCGVRPAFYGCTMQLAKRLHGAKTPDGKTISNALGSLARMYQVGGEKGDEVIHAKNLRRADFSPAQLAAYGNYCIKDVWLCGQLWKKLAAKFPMQELKLASLVTKMWAEPRLVLDVPLIEAMRTELLARKAELLGSAASMLGIDPSLPEVERLAQTQKLLRSDAKFADILRGLDVDVPMKPSKTRKDANGRAVMTYAFAKTDEAMTELAEYEEQDEETNLLVQTLATARLGTKSTQAEGRVERFLGIGRRGKLPVPYAYGKSHCDRLAGAQSINMQNLNRNKAITPKTPNGSLIMTPGGWDRLFKRKVEPDERTGKPKVVAVMDTQQRVWKAKDCHLAGLRDAVMAPPGYVLVVADSSNIELRTCHHLCGQEDSIALLRAGGDLYCDFATSYYGRVITKDDVDERQHGKTAELQLQFQSGWEAFRRAARIMSGMKLTEQEARSTVDIYRARRQNIVQKWKDAQRFIPLMAKGGGFYFDQWGLCYIEHNQIRFPTGMPMVYHNLRQEELLNFDGIPEVTWVYDDKEDRKMKKLYGGKVVQNCLTADTQVLTSEGWKPIVEVQSSDLVFDGVEFVTHCGVADQGTREVIEWQGIRGTPDHLILAGESWSPLTAMDENATAESLSLGRGLSEAWLSSQAAVSMASRFAGATAALKSALATAPCIAAETRGAQAAQCSYDPASSKASFQARLQRAFGWAATMAWSRVATTQATQRIPTTAGGVSECTSSGSTMQQSFTAGDLRFLKRCLRSWTWTVRTTMAITRPATAASCLGSSTLGTAVVPGTSRSTDGGMRCLTLSSRSCPAGSTPQSSITSARGALRSGSSTSIERVYDLVNCGPRNRFMVLTASGPVVVHNCTQRLARDVVFGQKLMIEKEIGSYERYGEGIVMSTHDEPVALVREDRAEETLKLMLEIMHQSPSWWPTLPVKAEGDINVRYGMAK